MRAFWPPAEAAQADYEALRAGVVAGTPLTDALAVRFARGGLAALLARPNAEPVFAAELLGAGRPGWTPYADPRLDALAAGYGLLLATGEDARPAWGHHSAAASKG
ncbi:MAG: hypothetical protein ACRET5_18510 [Steroidobacteraceae bacterium]